MSWVSPIDVSAKHLDVANIRQPGTSKWLLNLDIFKQWECGTGQALWCPGIPGAGKTVITSLLIDHLLDLQRLEPIGTMAVAWVYLDYNQEFIQTPDAIQLSLIRQLAVFSTELYDLLRSAYKKDPNIRPSPRWLIPDMHIIPSSVVAK